ncbi:MAG TPA: hypothetical protein PKA42_00495 [Candidatus Paceibacterota bacterium]|nr:hypothetical protein [Candidatus Paceibacterota bacterium]HMO82624.1 hypothetical protein [Candidatus Paceibacterota bacterium]
MIKSITFIQNILVSVFVFGFVFVSVYVPQPLNKVETAEAQWAVADFLVGLLQGIGNLYSAASNALQNLLVEKEIILDGIMFALAKAIVSQITASIVSWINSGFSGSPVYIQDLKTALLDAADQEFGYYLEELGGPLSFICSPFKLDVLIGITVAFDRRQNGEPRAGTCTLTGALANIENFISGDFEAGGWDAWFQIVNQPEIYTPYGSFLTAEIQGRLRVDKALERESTQLNWGKGFMSKKECSDPSLGPPFCQVVTPGDTIAQSLNFHLTAGTRSLIEADEINEIIGALLGQLAQTVITGAGGLLGVSAEGSGSGGTGTFLGDLAGEGFNLDSLRNSVSDSLAIAQRYRSEALLYSGLLAEFASTTTNDPTRRSQALRESQDIVQNLIPALDRVITELTALLSSIESAPSSPDTNFIRTLTERYSTLRSRLPSTSQVDASILQWRGMINPSG